MIAGKIMKYLRLNSNHLNKFRIICFCHAGGYAEQYSAWAKFLPPTVELIIYERPGMGGRMTEEVIASWEDLVQDSYDILCHFLNKPYLLFGHSLGGSVAFEFVNFIQQKGLRLPLRLCIGDRKAPDIPSDELIYLLPDDQFTKVLSKFGMAKELLENEDLMEFFSPLLRAEFKLADTYHRIFKSLPKKLSCPIVVFRPTETSDALEYHTSWGNVTHSGCTIIDISGAHFFVFTHTQQLIKTLVKMFE